METYVVFFNGNCIGVKDRHELEKLKEQGYEIYIDEQMKVAEIE